MAQMQNMIVEMVEEKAPTKRIYDLQRRLIMSFEARALAVRKVITNSGGKTAGVDKVILEKPEQYYLALGELKKIVEQPNKYRAKPLRRVYIPKPNGEQRPLGIPTIMDRILQALYLMAIDPIVEQKSDPNSFGFRKERSTIDAIVHFRNYMNKRVAPEWILEADISKCFDNISHEFLMRNTPICDKHILEEWLKSGIMYQGQYSDTKEGTPQGGVISPTLGNIALNGLEDYIKSRFPRNDACNSKIKVVRYADDIVITGRDEKTLLKCKQLLEEFLKERGLELSQKKTKITNIRTGIDFLGFNILKRQWWSKLNRKNQQPDVLIVRPDSKGIRKIISKVKEAFKKNNTLTEIITELNPILRGWTEHKRISWHSARIFSKLNLLIWQNIRTKFIKRRPKSTSQRRNYRKILFPFGEQK